MVQYEMLEFARKDDIMHMLHGCKWNVNTRTKLDC